MMRGYYKAKICLLAAVEDGDGIHADRQFGEPETHDEHFRQQR
jgi:hypothetical protein